MNLLKDILELINSITPETWAVIVQTVFVAITVSPLAEAIKKLIMHYKTWLDDPRRREKVMLLGVLLASLWGSVFAYVQTDPRFTGWFVIPQGIIAFGLTQPFYIYGLKPLLYRLGSYLTGKIAEANAINDAKAAALPATGLPITKLPEEEF